MKNKIKFLIVTTLLMLLFASLIVPALAKSPHRRGPTQYILEAGWMSSSDYWYAYIIQYDKKPATLFLSVYSQELGEDVFTAEKVLTKHDSFYWDARHTTLKVTFNYNGSPERLYINFWATEKPSISKGAKGDWVTAVGEATVRCLGNRFEGVNAMVISWREP